MTRILAFAKQTLINPDSGRPLSFEGYEYLLQPLEDLRPRIVIQKAAQVGATVLAMIRALWFVDIRQAHSMYLFPTHRSALRFSRGRFQVLLERSPYLRGKFRQVKAANHLRAGIANFYCHGGRSRAELMSTPAQYLTIDERDEMYLGKVGSPQPWSAIDLARQRLSGQAASWELNLSTPTIPDHGIAADFAQTDQHHYHPHCPHCQRHVRLSWLDAVAVEGNQAEFRCPRCLRPWTKDDRRAAIRQGRWIADHPERSQRGYHLSQLLSPAITATKLVKQWQAAQGHPMRMQVFCNATLGLPYLAEGSRLDARWIEEAMERGGYEMASASQGSVMGVDVGQTWFHVVIAEPAGDSLRLVWVGKVHDWKPLGDLVKRFNVKAYVIDAMPETHQVRAFLRVHRQGFLCWYRHGGGAGAVDPEAKTIRISRTESLDAMFLRWRLGKVTAPRDLPAEFTEQMTSPVRIVRESKHGDPVAVYLDAAGADHYAHAMNYCEMALPLVPRKPRFEVIAPAMGKVAWCV
jgi:hypothetical protein